MYSLVRRLALLFVCSLLTILLACGGESEPVTEGGIRSETVASHMEEHFVQAQQIKEAVISGDLEAMKASAEWIAQHQAAEGLPEGWEPYVTAMQSAARDIAAAADVEQAAAAAAQVASNCGACHAAVGARPLRILGSDIPPDPATVPHMRGHLWGADRMWEGLIVPSDVAWENGVAPLAGDPLQPHDLSDSAEYADELRDMAIRVHELAAEGREAIEIEARAEVYGGFIGTCARCHELLSITVTQ